MFDLIEYLLLNTAQLIMAITSVVSNISSVLVKNFRKLADTVGRIAIGNEVVKLSITKFPATEKELQFVQQHMPDFTNILIFGLNSFLREQNASADTYATFHLRSGTLAAYQLAVQVAIECKPKLGYRSICITSEGLRELENKKHDWVWIAGNQVLLDRDDQLAYLYLSPDGLRLPAAVINLKGEPQFDREVLGLVSVPGSNNKDPKDLPEIFLEFPTSSKPYQMKFPLLVNDGMADILFRTDAHLRDGTNWRLLSLNEYGMTRRYDDSTIIRRGNWVGTENELENIKAQLPQFAVNLIPASQDLLEDNERADEMSSGDDITIMDLPGREAARLAEAVACACKPMNGRSHPVCITEADMARFKWAEWHELEWITQNQLLLDRTDDVPYIYLSRFGLQIPKGVSIKSSGESLLDDDGTHGKNHFFVLPDGNVPQEYGFGIQGDMINRIFKYQSSGDLPTLVTCGLEVRNP